MSTTYEYKVRDTAGNLLTGKVEADSVPLVAGRLREMGYLPIEVKASAGPGLKREIHVPGLTDRVPLKEIALMSRQLATMVAAGLTLVRALTTLAENLDSKALRTVLVQVRDEVERGSAFSAALEKHERIFGELYTAMIRAGEVSGQLDTVLLRVADQVERQLTLRRKIRAAFTYPCLVVCVVVAIVLAMMIFVVPTFQHLYRSLNGTLPAPTRLLIAISHTLAGPWLLVVLAVVAAAAFVAYRVLHTDGGRELWHRVLLRLPVFGPLAHKVALSRFAGTVAALLNAGIGIMDALEIAAANVGNCLVANAARSARVGVRDGRPLAATLAEYPVMPTMVTQMVETGEQSGAVGDLLQKVATFYDNEVEVTVNSLTSILEPLLIVFMGICIGFVIISLYLPMFDYVKLLQG